MRLPSVGSATALALLLAAATNVNAQGVAPLTNYGPQPGFFTPQASTDLARGITAAARSMGPQVMPAVPVPLLPPPPVSRQPDAAIVQPVPVAESPAAAPSVPAPFVRIPDPTQGQAPSVNSHPLAVAADARAAETAKAEQQMDQVERENERTR